MPRFEIIIPIVPKAQKRHRSRIAKGRDGASFVHSYKSSEARNEEGNLRSMLHRALPLEFLYPITTAINIQVAALLPIPSSMTKRDRKRVEEGELRHSKKPDIDNLAKAILDCMRGIIFLDDRQVWAMDISKLYSEHPSWKIRIEW